MPIKMVPSFPENPEVTIKSNIHKGLLQKDNTIWETFAYQQNWRYSLHRSQHHLSLQVAEKSSSQYPPVHIRSAVICLANISEKFHIWSNSMNKRDAYSKGMQLNKWFLTMTAYIFLLRNKSWSLAFGKLQSDSIFSWKNYLCKHSILYIINSNIYSLLRQKPTLISIASSDTSASSPRSFCNEVWNSFSLPTLACSLNAL